MFRCQNRATAGLSSGKFMLPAIRAQNKPPIIKISGLLPVLGAGIEPARPLLVTGF